MTGARILVAQGGGPTAVVNQSLAGVALVARRRGAAAVFGARNGIQGAAAGDWLDLGAVAEAQIESVAAMPGSALGSTRDKPDAAYCERLLRAFDAQRIGSFVYIGGDGTAAAANDIANAARAAGYPLNVVHVPKTIDNDLAGNDHTPGYGSAARFIAAAFAGAELDNRSLPGVWLGVTMGRNAGWLAAAAALARDAQGEGGPHLIYLPERAFAIERFLADVQAVVARRGRCIVVVSEGIRDAQGRPIAAADERDPAGNVRFSGSGVAEGLCDCIRSQLGIARVRGDTFGVLQRSLPGWASESDAREARAAGEHGARLALAGGEGSITIRRAAGAGYEVDYAVQPLAAAAGPARLLEARFIAAAGNDVTGDFIAWARPLVGPLPPLVHLAC